MNGQFKYFLLCLVCAMICAWLILAYGCTIINPPRATVTALEGKTPLEAMEFARDIHQAALRYRPNDSELTKEWNRRWVEIYDQVIDELKCKPGT